jgi:hypothetical protein
MIDQCRQAQGAREHKTRAWENRVFPGFRSSETKPVLLNSLLELHFQSKHWTLLHRVEYKAVCSFASLDRSSEISRDQIASCPSVLSCVPGFCDGRARPAVVDRLLYAATLAITA